jgi:proline racemase
VVETAVREPETVYEVQQNAQRRGLSCGGEPGKVVVGGVGNVPGQTMFEKRVYVEQNLDQLRALLLFEPRGAVWHNANIVLPSNNPEAALGYVILESTEYPAMSGSNTMCVATVLLETGMLPMARHRAGVGITGRSDPGAL